MSLTLSSPAFASNGPLPPVYTADGRDVPPPLTWSGVSASTRSLVLVVDDPDAPDPAAPQRTWTHWLLYNLPPSAGRLDADHALPKGTRVGRNDFGHASYGGPCPPIGRHRYYFKLYALDTKLPDLHQPDAAALAAAMNGHVLESTSLVGTYARRSA